MPELTDWIPQDAYREAAHRDLNPGLISALGANSLVPDTELRQSISAAGGLVSSADIGRRLGFSKAHASRLTHGASFPWPVGTVNGHPVWSWRQVQKWLSARPMGRKGRQ
jgi:hypothetical protein